MYTQYPMQLYHIFGLTSPT